MKPATRNWDLYRGDTFREAFRLWANAEGTDPLDLSDSTVKAQMRDKPGGEVVVDLVTTVLTDADTGIQQIVLVDMGTDQWEGDPKPPFPKGAWDLQCTDSEGNVLTPVAGVVNITMDVTDSTS